MRARTLRYSSTLGSFDTSPLSDFAKDKEVLSFREHFFRVEGLPHLACVVSWQERPQRAAAQQFSATAPREPREDPTAGLDEAERTLFNSFREWRNVVARRDGLFHYLVLRNSQIKELIQKRPRSLTALAQIDGLGKSKVEKYGPDILRLLAVTADAAEAGA